MATKKENWMATVLCAFIGLLLGAGVGVVLGSFGVMFWAGAHEKIADEHGQLVYQAEGVMREFEATADALLEDPSISNSVRSDLEMIREKARDFAADVEHLSEKAF